MRVAQKQSYETIGKTTLQKLKIPTTYMIANKKDGVIYIGVTSQLRKRIEKHKKKTYKNSFSAKYNVNKLVWYEEFTTMLEAIKREKQIKAGSRAKKIKLIESINPEWKDLYDTL